MKTRAGLRPILDNHAKWLRGEGGCRADLSWSDLSGSDLSWSDLSRINLSEADMHQANLRHANMSRADMTRTNLSWTDMTRANLSWTELHGANLHGANLHGAYLRGTILDSAAPMPPLTDEEIDEAGLERSPGRVYGWRTAQSRYVGGHKYRPGWHKAPWFSVDMTAECHPGIYLASRAWLESEYPGAEIVPCWCYRDELLRAGDKWRAKRIYVLKGERQ